MALSFPRAFRDLDVIPSQFDRIFDEMVRGVVDRPFGWELRTSAWSPSMEVYETDNEMLVGAELPGVQPNDIDVRIENNVLTVRGERKIEEDASRGHAHRKEFCYGTFVRSITLPATIDQDRVSAELKDGVLRVRLPKTEQARARQVQIEAPGKTQRALASPDKQATAAREPELVGAGDSSQSTGKRR
jgi:HSP20 family protein